MEFLKPLLTLISISLLASCGKYMETELQKSMNLKFDSKGTLNIVLQSNFVTKSNKSLKSQSFDSSQKRILVLISSQRCSACKDEHLLIKQKIDNKTLDSTKFEIVSFMIATDFSDSYDFISVEELMDHSNMHWPIGEDQNLNYFNKFCTGGTTPCSVILEPNQGIVYSHNGVPDINEIKPILNK